MATKINSHVITARLVEIRKDVGVSLVDFIPPSHRARERTDRDLNDDAVRQLIDESGLLIDNGSPVFVYIRDHTGHFSRDSPSERNKIHFTKCGTLKAMENANRLKSRYRVTNRDDNRYWIDVSAGWHKFEERLVTLYPCQPCLEKVRYRGFHQTMDERRRLAIIQSFDAKAALNFLRERFETFRSQATTLRSATSPTSYAENWPENSHAYRTKKNFTCEEGEGCGVNLKRNPHLTDTHHIDGDKTNDDDDNLQCLCKLCHKKKHPHYWVSESDRREIENARKQQNISVL